MHAADAETWPPFAATTDVLRRARDFLCAQQDAEGTWRDFVMPPGEGDAWVTAYVGRALQRLEDPAVEPALQRAARWLAAHAEDDGGWSYRAQQVPSDCDSTAHVLHFLAARKVGAVTGYQRLLAFQHADGGFSTYDASGPPGSWTVPHTCVTPAAAAALLDVLPPSDGPLSEALDWIERAGRDGLWPSFWWTAAWYATALSLETLSRAQRRIDRALVLQRVHALPTPESAFDRAMALRCFIALADARSVPRFRSALLRSQCNDGSWESTPMLRLVKRSCTEPWAHADAGPLFADERRLFTTATVVHALALAGETARR